MISEIAVSLGLSAGVGLLAAIAGYLIAVFVRPSILRNTVARRLAEYLSNADLDGPEVRRRQQGPRHKPA